MTGVFKFSHLIFSLTFCMALQSCNKEDFYQKEFLDNPFQDGPVTDGVVDGGAQGGADSGVDSGSQGGDNSGATDGGTTGSTNGPSTSGGTDGSVTGGTTDGGTAGGVDGSTTSGGTTGSSAGGVDGSTTSGGTTGTTTGGVDGSTTSGGTTGTTTGVVDGSTTSGSTTGSSTGGVDGSTTSGGTTGSTTGGTSTGGSYGDCNNGHGNDADGVDESNPTIGLEEKCKLEKFKQTASTTKKLDIMWIIDNSGSMADEQSALGSNFSAFIDEFITKDVDFKMGITTTDTTYTGLNGGMVNGSATKLTSAKARLNEEQFKSDFKNMVKVGTMGSSYEKGLEASMSFMKKNAQSFIRPDAYLAVVILTDEEDQSPKEVNAYTDFLKSFKNEAGLVKVYTIADINNTNSGRGITTGAKRYIQASQETAGIVANIRDDFHTTLSAMGDSILSLLDSFALASNPVPGSLRVYVNDVETTDYTFDAASRSIKFESSRLPPVGAEIKVYYIKQ